MNDSVRDMVRALRGRRIPDAKRRGEGHELFSPYVFCPPQGGYLKNFHWVWYGTPISAQIEDLHLHDLRHTFASRLVMAGVNLYTVQKLLGHKTTTMMCSDIQ